MEIARSGLWTPDLRRIFCFSLCKIKRIGSLVDSTTATCHTRAKWPIKRGQFYSNWGKWFLRLQPVTTLSAVDTKYRFPQHILDCNISSANPQTFLCRKLSNESCVRNEEEITNKFSYECNPWTPPSICAEVVLFSNLSSPEYIIDLKQIHQDVKLLNESPDLTLAVFLTALQWLCDVKKCIQNVILLRFWAVLRDKKRVSFALVRLAALPAIDCKTVGFFPSKSFSLALDVAHARSARASHNRRTCEAREKSVSRRSRSPFSASLQTSCLIVCKYLNTQKGGLFCSLRQLRISQVILNSSNKACWNWLIKAPSFSWSTNISCVTGTEC